MTNPEVRVRLANDDDTDAILDVCGEALGWTDPTFDRELFQWKHHSNAFGPSLIIIAEDDTGLLAVRPLMQWRFTTGNDGINAARAVDTATRPRAQGKGLFRRLTEAGLVELLDRSFDFVFNTPNEKSRPGYLKMGWEVAGQIGFGFGLRSVASLPRVARSRTAASKKSIDTPELGVDVTTGLRGVELRSLEPSDAGATTLRTDHTRETLLWRYAQGPISYRWLAAGPNAGCVVRLRQRGASRELVVAYHTGNQPTPAMSDAVRSAMQQVRADYCLTPAGFGRTLTVPALGPTLTLRTVARQPDPHGFHWQPGDIELF